METLLKIVAGTNLKISFVVDVRREDLETIKCLAIGEGLDAIWDELSQIKADREAYQEPFVNSIPKNQKLDVDKEYCVEDPDVVMIMEKFKSLLNGVERVWDDTTQIISDIQQLDAKVHKMVKVQECIERKLDSVDVDFRSGQVRIEKKVDLCKTGMGKGVYDEVIVVKDSVMGGEHVNGTDQRKDRKYSCPYCQEDNHRFADCEEKTECMRCGNNNHKLDNCNFKSDMKYYVCKEVGHVSMLHSAVKVDFRLALLNHYGSKCFGPLLESKEEEE